MTIDSDMAALVGFGCEAFLYGCYTVLFAVSIYLISIGPRRGSGVNMPILIISVLLYLSCSAHFALEFDHFYETLLTRGVDGFAIETHNLFGADLLISIADFMGELILIYRCWLLWSKNYRVVTLPCFTAIAGVACFSEAVYLLLSMSPRAVMIPASVIPLGLAGIILPLITNVILTTLIAMRIRYLSPRQVRDMRSAQFTTGTGRAVIEIVIESGMLYLAVQFVFVILFAIQHPARVIFGAITVQIYGIAPTLILVRVALGMSLSNMQPGDIRRGAASSTSQPTSSTKVRISFNTISFTDDGLPAGMPMSELKSKRSSEDLGSSVSSAENAITV